MKFLFIAPRFHTNQYGAIKGLLANGHQVKFLADKAGRTECYDQVKPCFIDDKFFTRILQFHKMLKNYKPDIIIIRGFNVKNIMYSFISRRFTRKIILYTQDPLYLDIKYNSKAIARKKLLNTISRVRITPVPGEPSDDSFHLPHEYYVPFVVEPLSVPKEKEYFLDGRINILCIGKLTLERKNHILLLKAIHDLRNAYPIRLNIVGALRDEGNPYYGEIKDYIHRNALGDIVTIKPNVPYRQCREEYMNHDLFILPSRNEPAAVSHLEAMSYGLPVICSDTNGTKSYMEENRNGFIFHTDNLEDLKDKIIKIISKKDILIRMGKESLRIVQQKYSPLRYYNDISEIIKLEFN